VTSEVGEDRVESVRVQLRGPWEDGEERTVVAGAIAISVRKRGHRYDLDDRGDAVAQASARGARRDWLRTAEDVVAREGFNVNRRGVVFVGAVEGRDLARLAVRLADCAESVRAALLEDDRR